MALMSAIAGAAVAAAIVVDAMAHSGPAMEEEAERARANAMMLTIAPVEYPAVSSAKAPTNADKAICQRRSSVRSECSPIKTMKIVATR